MASPAPATQKRSRKGKEKVREPQIVKEELLTQQDEQPRRRKTTRGAAALNATQGESSAGQMGPRTEC